MVNIRFNGEEYHGDMTLSNFCKSLEIKNFQFFAHPEEFIKVDGDPRLKGLCDDLGINHIQ